MHASVASSSSAQAGVPPPPPVSGEGGGDVNNSKADEKGHKAAAEWLAAERLSFKEILARADPGAEFRWRRQLEEEMVEASGGEGRVGGGR